MSQGIDSTLSGDVSQWLHVAGAMMVAAGIVSRVAWQRLRDRKVENKAEDRGGSSVGHEKDEKESTSEAASKGAGRKLEEVIGRGGGSGTEAALNSVGTTERTEKENTVEITDMSSRLGAKEAISKWTLKVEAGKAEERRTAIEHERIEQQKFEKAMAEKMKRYVTESTVEIWKVGTVEESNTEKDIVNRGKRLAVEIAKMWLMRTTESKVKKRRKGLEERRIQQEEFEQKLAEKRRQAAVLSAGKTWRKTTSRNRWREEEKRKRAMLEEAFAKEKFRRRQSVEKDRDDERKRITEDKNVRRQGEDCVREQPPYLANSVLTPEEALSSCETLGQEKLLSWLNAKLGTNYTIPISEEISEALQFCVSQNYDFGLACALLRGNWNQLNSPTPNRPRLNKSLESEEIEKRRREEDLQRLKQDSNGHLVIESPYAVRPRRVWDLRSHRVIPWESADLSTSNLWAISHSWVMKSERRTVKTSVNGYEWPIPVPIGVTLETVRNELLHHGAEYCWLDVLCLRQHEGSGAKGPMEQMRVMEWEIDVPTIGNVYFGDLKVLRYYNGLGRPFETSGWESKFHWTNRAWTLQECKRGSITGGLSDENAEKRSLEEIEDGRYAGLKKAEFEQSRSYIGISELLEIRAPAHFLQKGDTALNVTRTACGLFGVLSEMQLREADKDVDKVAGIGFLMSGPAVTLPIFSESIDPEVAWTRCVRNMTPSMRDELLFRFPEPGNQNHLWFPSWAQIHKHELPEDPVGPFWYKDMGGHCTSPNSTTYTYYGYYIEGGNIAGLDVCSRAKRSGVLTIEREGQDPVRFRVSAHHKNPIPDGRYSLVGRINYSDFVVCSYTPRAPHQSFMDLEKISVLCMEYVDESKLKEAGAMGRLCKFI